MTNPSPLDNDPVAVRRLIELSDPIIVLSVLVEALRNRFSEEFSSNPALRWKWQRNLKATDILIERGFEENAEVRNGRPGIWVDRIRMETPPDSIGHQDQHPEILKTGAQRFWARNVMDISVDCTAGKHGESMMIASIVYIFLLMTRGPLMARFGFRDTNIFTMGRTVPHEKDTEIWTTPISFRVDFETRWNVRETEMLVNAITARVVNALNEDDYRLMEIKSS